MAVSLMETLVQLARQNRTVRLPPCRLCERARSLPPGPPPALFHGFSVPVPPLPLSWQVCTTIHQPNSIITGRFDDYMLLHSGATVYYGRWEGVVDYFAAHGCPCPQCACGWGAGVQEAAGVQGGAGFSQAHGLRGLAAQALAASQRVSPASSSLSHLGVQTPTRLIMCCR